MKPKRSPGRSSAAAASRAGCTSLSTTSTPASTASPGYRNFQKALLFALLQPEKELKALQDEGKFTRLMVLQEELKTLPFGEIWDEYCRRCGKPADGEWFSEIETYEAKVLEARA